MAKKFYVVWVGREPGVYDDWPSTEKQVKGYSGARHKAFSTKEQAEAAFAGQPVAKPTSTASTSVRQDTEASAPTSEVEIYCDGACEGNPGPCGTGIAIYEHGTLEELWYGLHRPSGTNNIAELLGLQYALSMAKEYLAKGMSVTILSDSTYSIDCITNWAFGWKAKGWTKKGGEIKNLELIQTAHASFVELQDRLSIDHVRGHAGIEGNELADRMSMVAIARQETELKQFTDSLSITEVLSLERG